MYLPVHFKEVSAAEIASVMRAAPLACIVAQTDAGLIANHLPLLTVADGALVGHVALANDMHRLLSDGQEVLVIFGGEKVLRWMALSAKEPRARRPRISERSRLRAGSGA